MFVKYEATGNTVAMYGTLVDTETGETRVPVKGGHNVHTTVSFDADKVTVTVGEWLRFERKVYS